MVAKLFGALFYLVVNSKVLLILAIVATVLGLIITLFSSGTPQIREIIISLLVILALVVLARVL